MSTTTSIEWTDKTWNPVRGCSIVSPGCVNCYAMKQAHRFSGKGQPYEGLTKLTANSGPQWTGEVRTVEDALLEPLSWRKPARVFVNSMSDLFHESVPEAFIAEVFAVMRAASRHAFQVLTKRPNRMAALLSSRAFHQRVDALTEREQPWPLPNVWLGVSCENQQTADERIPLLLQTPAAIRWVSAEPLLGPIDFHSPVLEADCDGYVNWVVVGGESGADARPCDRRWIYDILRQCQDAGVPAFVKQLGAKSHIDDSGSYLPLANRKGGDISEFPPDLRVREYPAVRA